jgi:ketosteroid isomerase-like protein
VALVGLAISFAFPTFAQQNDTPDPQLLALIVSAIGFAMPTFHDTDSKDKHIDGHYSWILVRQGDSWKIRRDTGDEGTGY